MPLPKLQRSAFLSLHKLLPLFASSSLLFANPTEDIFTFIYQLGTWDDSGFSHSGSQVEVTHEYMDYLQRFLIENDIKSVVDVGCGDWAFSRYIDWEGIDYLGIDIVKHVVERNQELFSAPNIAFAYMDALNEDLPQADLIIFKDIFQHLSNEDIQKLLAHLPNYKHCLITNYIDEQSPSKNNAPIQTGYYHPIDMSLSPFQLKGERVLTFFSGVATKQTFYLQPTN